MANLPNNNGNGSNQASVINWPTLSHLRPFIGLSDHGSLSSWSWSVSEASDKSNISHESNSRSSSRSSSPIGMKSPRGKAGDEKKVFSKSSFYYKHYQARSSDEGEEDK
jgi:hypothetical protein